MSFLSAIKGHIWDGDSQKIVHAYAEDKEIRVVTKKCGFYFSDSSNGLKVLIEEDDFNNYDGITIFLDSDGTVIDAVS